MISGSERIYRFHYSYELERKNFEDGAIILEVEVCTEIKSMFVVLVLVVPANSKSAKSDP